MNETVKKLVEILFRDAEDNEEVRALQEEILRDSQEKYEDLVRSGMTEDEAIAQIVESLQGMDELVDGIGGHRAPVLEVPGEEPWEAPRMERTEKQEPAQEGRAKSFSGNGSWVLDAGSSPELDLRLVSADIRVETWDSTGIQVEIMKDENGTVHGNMDGGVLRMEQTSRTQKVMEGGYAGVLRRLLSGSLDIHLSLGSDAPRVLVRIPAACRTGRLESRSGDITLEADGENWKLESCSGEITCKGTVERLTMKTLSGNIELSGNGGVCQAGSTSGDVEIRGNWEALRVASSSGDVEFNGRAGKLEGESVSGDVEIQTEASREVIVSSRSGDVSMTGQAEEVSVESVSGDAEVRTVSGARVNLRSVSGDADFQGSAARLEISTVSGDAEAYFTDLQLREVQGKSVSGDIRLHLAPGTESIRGKLQTRSGDARSKWNISEDGHVLVQLTSISGDLFVE